MKATMRTILRSAAFVGALTGLLATAAIADVKPHSLISDGAVLQQGMKVPIWGTASEGEKVTVAFQNQKVSTTTNGGKWMVMLKPLKAGGPFTMTITGNNTVEVKNLLVGEVWICSGQSNMQWPLSLASNGPEAIAASADPMLRLYSVPLAASDTPVPDVNQKWYVCAPNTVPNFSAVGYFFGRDLRKALKVPVGLINSSFGGTPAEAWTNRPALDADSALRVYLDNYAKAREAYLRALPQYQRQLQAYNEAVAKAKAEGKEPPKKPEPPYNPQDQNRPSGLYNAMIVPLQPFAFRGAIWYQGESNAGQAYLYQNLFPTMIRSWRDAWGEGDFPFFFVQLAPFQQIQQEPQESAWAELREAQRLTTFNSPRTGMAVITDVGDERDIHPRKKEPVGARLALAARAIAYGQHLVYSGPTPDSMKVEGNSIVVRFKNVGGGLVAEGGELKGFTIAGEDRKFYNAQAQIKGNTVVVSSPQVPKPIAARFGWANYPVVNLFNKEGLPATPFRTDTFPMVTQPK